MGKSTSSCFRMLSCVADSTDYDDPSPAENKASSDKSRWSFRKRSARHQVPSNSIISEPLAVGYDKENPEATTNNFYSAKDSSVPGKNTIVERVNETAPLSSAVVNSEVTDTLDSGKITTAIDANFQEYFAVVIQAAIRRFLAQRELQKLKNVVKLQAAVRGHLVRRQAIGTLRCVQAIVKMQALVRARHARQSLEKCAAQEKLDEKIQIDSQWSTVLVKRNSDLKSNKKNHTIEKLLSNGFARQLLDTTPKTKPIHISCDPLRPDSAWQWLERWMAVTSSKVGQQQELNWNQGYQGKEENSNLAAFEEVDVITVKAAPISSESNLSPIELAAVEGERDSVTDNSGKFEFQAPLSVPDQCFSSSAKNDKEQSQGEEDLDMNQENFTETGRVKETSDPVSSQLLLQLDATSQSKPDINSKEPEFVTENLKCTSKREACDPMETEGKKFEVGSRKARNPAFAAVQAKFEELSSAPRASTSNVNSQVDSMIKTKEFSSTENSTTQNPIVQVAASECGTEISISSTLDSPDRSEADGGEIVLEIGTSVEGNHDVNSGAGNAFSLENMNAEAKQPSNDSNVFQRQRHEENDGDVANFAVVDSVQVEQHMPEPTTSGIQFQLENSKDPHISRSLPEGSPRSHVNVPESHGTPSSQVSVHESHGTPSSQVSVHTKASKTQNNIPTRKPKTKLVSKSSPPNLKNDSGERSSTEHLPKDAKNSKRQSSLGMAKLDHLDHEPRVSSSNSLPSYMQATESARAKAHGSVSLKSSPDVHDKDISLKKRHSLPIEDGKQGSSPRVQRPTSQAQQSLKGTHSPHNSAERRWQR